MHRSSFRIISLINLKYPMLKRNFNISLILLIAGSAYLLTLYPGAVVFANDSARFQFLGKVLGTAHTTGYPLYTLINHLFVNIFPLGNLAFKVNLLSAIFTLLALIFLYRILVLVELSPRIAFMGTLIFAFTRMVWKQSVMAEIYTLHLLFVSIVVYFLLKWSKTLNGRDFFISLFFYAVSFGNHLTTITLLPAIIYFVWVTDRKVFVNPKKIMWIFIFIIIGALQYAYLFWRFYDPDGVYLQGQVYDLKSFINFISGAGWKSNMFRFSLWEILFKRLPVFFYELMIEFFYLLFPVGIWGALSWKKKRMNIFLLLCFFGNTLFAVSYDIWDIDPYFIPSFFIFSIYVAIGFRYLSEYLGKKLKKPGTAVLAMMGFMVVSLLGINFHYNKFYSQPEKIAASQRVKDILLAVGENSIIIAPDYAYLEGLRYYLLGEGLEKERGIYVVHNSQLADIKDYILKKKLFVLPQQRKQVPPALKVFCMEKDKQQLERMGFQTKPVIKDLFLLQLSSSKSRDGDKERNRQKAPIKIDRKSGDGASKRKNRVKIPSLSIFPHIFI